MQTLAEFKQSLMDWLQNQPALPAQVLGEYAENRRGTALSRPLVAVGIHQVETKPAPLGSFLGEDAATGHLFGRQAEITLRLDILAPKPQQCHTLLEALCDLLVLGSCPFPFSRLWSGELRSDAASGGVRLTAHATLPAAFAARDTALAIEHIRVQQSAPFAKE